VNISIFVLFVLNSSVIAHFVMVDELPLYCAYSCVRVYTYI